MGGVANQHHAAKSAAPAGASHPAGLDVPDPGQPFLAADIGGTHARIGLVAGRASGRRPVSVLHYHRYSCADWSGLAAMLQDFVDQLAGTPHAALREQLRHCAVACAGYVLDDAIVNENLPWPVSIREIRDGLGIRRLMVINDFEALAYATQFIGADETQPVIDATLPSAPGPVLVMGPGTGLGSAVLLPGQPRAQVLATEAGQVALAPGNEREIEILRLFRRQHSHVPFEDALSGPGLLRLYRALCELRGGGARALTPAEVTAAALAGHDVAAVEALEVFCGLLGSFVGDLVLLYGARGGAYLAGGILPQIQPFLRASTFAERYFNKGVMRAYLQQVPVRLIEHGQLGVIGAAGWFLDGRDGATG
ncbi:glucokinase [Rhodanobacter denitrificans]|uniref:Glucokinase n=1 Tax=Rhodanobacter denitrificans TaxID=666685 RepID=A0A368K9N7_9GAMM|nr:glucokinase [Rhodanobacter denitrificans]RCS28659.1 glucokinase [Rhodanobacter denitrificans]